MSNEDRAQDEEAFHWTLRNGGRQTPPDFKPGDEGYGPARCRNEDCEDEMPETRRRMGRAYCTTCQSLAENTARRRY